MSFPPSDLVILGTMGLAALVGMLWVSRRMRDETAAEEMPTLHMGRLPRARRSANDNNGEEAAPESGIRVRAGANANIRRLDARR